MIELIHVTKKFNDFVVFQNVNLSIQHCGIHILLGESGCGKSTLLNMMAGYEKVTEGEIHTSGTLATIFQNYELIPELSVRDNIYMAKEITNQASSQEEMILSLLGLNELMNYYPHELSGGQKQRVGIARALFQNPDIILCDEPTESLDQENKQIVMQLLKQLSLDHIIVIATHDQLLIQEYGDMIYRIQDKQIHLEILHVLSKISQNQEIKPINSNKVNFYIKKIITKKSILFSILISILCILSLSLYHIEKSLFQPPTTFESVTQNKIYIQSMNKSFNFEELQLPAQPLLQFHSFSFDQKTYRVLSVPYIKNSLEIKGKAPQGNEVLINQNIAKRLKKDCIGKKIVLKYELNGVHHQYECIISGIIYENDIQREALYYDEKALQKELKALPYNDDLSLFDYLQTSSSYYVLSSPYDKIEEIYDTLSDYPELIVESPLFDERSKEMQSQKLYQTIFQITELFLMLGSFITLVIYCLLDTKKYMKNCAIFMALQVSAQQVKRKYLFNKIFIFSLIYGLNIIIYGCFSLFFTYSLTKQEMIYPIVFILSLYLVYILILMISMNRLKQNKINEILKGQDA